MPTSLRDAFLVPWIFPRPKKVSTGHFLTLAALGPAFQIRPHQQKINPIRMDGVYFLAEKEGFEPWKPFWGLHDFQSCALGQLRDFSKCCNQLAYNTTFIGICQALFCKNWVKMTGYTCRISLFSRLQEFLREFTGRLHK